MAAKIESKVCKAYDAFGLLLRLLPSWLVTVGAGRRHLALTLVFGDELSRMFAGNIFGSLEERYYVGMSLSEARHASSVLSSLHRERAAE